MKTPMQYFEELSAIPRVSGNEAAAVDYVEALAKAKGFTTSRDAMHNLIVVKPATPGYEAADTLLLQGHIDMVGEKKPGVEHDFTEDPIRLLQDGDILRADGTTLGADDGVAVAYMLAILADDSLQHPRLECVFTTQEETGLFGALALDMSGLKATRMVNLDAGPEGVLLVTCAGGCRVRVKRALNTEPVQGDVWKLTISGLKGGHSGANMQDERANAIVLAGLAADALRQKGGRVVSVSGGDKDNVIPAEAELVFAMPGSPALVLEPLALDISKTWAVSDPDIKLQWQPAEAAEMLDEAGSDLAVDLLLAMPHGVVSMSAAMPGLLESSANLAAASIGKDGLQINVSLRSSADLRKKQLLRRVQSLAVRCGCSVELASDYPGWAYEPVSPLRDKCVEVYTRLYGKAPSVEGIHAGLECGVFKGNMPALDIVATGPLYKEMHTPNEWLDVPSFERTYTFLTILLQELG